MYQERAAYEITQNTKIKLMDAENAAREDTFITSPLKNNMNC